MQALIANADQAVLSKNLVIFSSFLWTTSIWSDYILTLEVWCYCRQCWDVIFHSIWYHFPPAILHLINPRFVDWFSFKRFTHYIYGLLKFTLGLVKRLADWHMMLNVACLVTCSERHVLIVASGYLHCMIIKWRNLKNCKLWWLKTGQWGEIHKPFECHKCICRRILSWSNYQKSVLFVEEAWSTLIFWDSNYQGK